MGRKVLVIDDSAMLRRIATSILGAAPGRYDVVTATRAAEGFALACVSGAEVIFLDYILAGLDDVSLCRRLQADARTARVPTILMVGQGVRPPPLSALPANVVDTLVKPFAPEQLSGLVNTVFSFGRTGGNLRDLRGTLHPDQTTTPPQSPPPRPVDILRQPSAAAATLETVPAVPRGTTAEDVQESKVLYKGTTLTTALCAAMRKAETDSLTGVLKLWTAEAVPTEIVFEDGRIVVVSTRDADAYAERAMDALPAKISPATLSEAKAEQKATGTPFLLHLGVRGLLSKASAVALLHRFGQRQFARIWPRPAQAPVNFEFRSLSALPQTLLRLEPTSLSVDQWLLDSTRLLRGEDTAENLRHEGSVGTPSFHADGPANARVLALAEDERAFLRLVNGRTDLPTVAKALGISPEAAYLTLFRFRCLDVLGYRTAPAAFVMTPRTNLRRVLPLKR